MEDILDHYEKPFNPREPLICLDEQPYQLLDDARPFEPAAPGKAAKQEKTKAEVVLDDNPHLKTAVQQIEKQFGEGAIMPLGSAGSTV